VSASDSDFQPWADSATGPQVAFTAQGVELQMPTLEGDTLVNADGTSDATALVSGVFALLRARFPNESARDLVTRAIAAAHNGLGHPGRIDDRQGYGTPLPKQAMQLALTGSMANPIYDQFDQQLGAASGSPSASASQPGSSQSPGGSTGASTGSDAVNNGDSSKRFPLLLVGAIGAGVLVLVVAVIVAIVAISSRRARRRAPIAAGYPPLAGPPGHYPPQPYPPPSGPQPSSPPLAAQRPPSAP
jgi:hypothetical protein